MKKMGRSSFVTTSEDRQLKIKLVKTPRRKMCILFFCAYEKEKNGLIIIISKSCDASVNILGIADYSEHYQSSLRKLSKFFDGAGKSCSGFIPGRVLFNVITYIDQNKIK